MIPNIRIDVVINILFIFFKICLTSIVYYIFVIFWKFGCADLHYVIFLVKWTLVSMGIYAFLVLNLISDWLMTSDNAQDAYVKRLMVEHNCD